MKRKYSFCSLTSTNWSKRHFFSASAATLKYIRRRVTVPIHHSMVSFLWLLFFCIFFLDRSTFGTGRQYLFFSISCIVNFIENKYYYNNKANARKSEIYRILCALLSIQCLLIRFGLYAHNRLAPNIKWTVINTNLFHWPSTNLLITDTAMLVYICLVLHVRHIICTWLNIFLYACFSG